MHFTNLSFFCLILTLIGCGRGADQGSASSDELFDFAVIHPGQDTLSQYGIELDLVRVEGAFNLKFGGQEIPVQIEDRNQNGTPDKMFTFVDLMPGSSHRIRAYGGVGIQQPAGVKLHANLIDGKEIKGPHLVNFDETWSASGIVMENEWVGYRALMVPPYAFDIIGKRKPDLLDSPISIRLDQVSNWGGDALDEGLSLGIASPVIYDMQKIVPLTNFDSKQIEIVETGPLRSVVHMTIKGLPVRDEKIDLLIKWQLHAGKHWSQIDASIVSKTDLNLQFAFGLPKHEKATDFTQGLMNNVHFAYTYGLQSSEGEHLGMAVMVPGRYEMDTYRDDPHNYFYLATPIDQAVQYRFLSSWVKDRLSIFDEVAFLDFLIKYTAEYGAPVSVEADFRL